MRPTQLTWLFRLVGAGGIGTTLGLAVAGVLGLVTGQMSAEGNPWLVGLPGFVLLGALAGVVTARITRSWLGLRIHRRYWVFTAVGAIAVPLALSLGQMPEQFVTAAVAFAAVGWVSTVTLRIRALRRDARHFYAAMLGHHPGHAQAGQR